jgi:hypothetical protein
MNKNASGILIEDPLYSLLFSLHVRLLVDCSRSASFEYVGESALSVIRTISLIAGESEMGESVGMSAGVRIRVEGVDGNLLEFVALAFASCSR